MSQILKLAQLAQNNGVPKVNIRAGRVDPELHSERPTEREFFAQLVFADDLGSALFEQGQGFVRLHGPNEIPHRRGMRYLFLFSNSRICSIVIGGFLRSSDFWLLPFSRKGRFPA